MSYHNAWKGLALVLAALLMTALLFGMTFVTDLYMMGLYDTTLEDQVDTAQQLRGSTLAQYMVNRYARVTFSDYPSYETIDSIEQLMESASYTARVLPDAWCYTITDDTGAVLDRYQPDWFNKEWNWSVYEYRLSGTYEILSTPEQADYQVYAGDETLDIRQMLTPEYTVCLYFMPEALSYVAGYPLNMLRAMYEHRFSVLLLMAALGLLLLADLIYLCCAAGRRRRGEPVRPGGLNRVPLDLYAGAVAFTLYPLVILLSSISPWQDIFQPWIYHKTGQRDFSVLEYIASAGIGFVSFLLLTGFGYALVAQAKTPGKYLLKNTLIARLLRGILWILRKICYYLGRFFSLLPFTWQWLLTAIYLALWILLAVGIQSELLLIFALAQAVGITVYGALCFGELYKTTRRIAEGDLKQTVKKGAMIGAFRDFARRLDTVSDAASAAADSQIRAERLKTELITNVSHDIKTPLTSIISYVDLLKNQEDASTRQEYLQILESQSLRLKKLIEDLTELNKASTGNLPVEMSLLDAAEAVKQALGEFSDKFAAAQLILCPVIPEEPVFIQADGRLLWRVLANLLSNTVKYSQPNTRVYVLVQEQEDRVEISVKNISAQELNISAQELMERFVRGDASRNTEGSGLGLSIAQSLMQAQGGRLELCIDGDLFKATALFFTNLE